MSPATLKANPVDLMINEHMKQEDDYITGPHHYGTHFWCGLVAGAAIGAWIGWERLGGGWRGVGAVIVVSVVLAYSCGRWGDRAWHGLIKLLTSTR